MTQVANIGAHAIAYIKRGWAVIPLWWVNDRGECACKLGSKCSSKGKHPHTIGTTKPLTTMTEVELYWYHNPNCNIGIATGKVSGLVVLDIDPKHGGKESALRLWKKYGAPKNTPVSQTGGGGWHILFQHPGTKVKNAVGYKPGLDVRADGGLIVVPPSNHESGNRYKWISTAHPRDYKKLSPMPKWMFIFIEANETKINSNRGLKNGGRYGRILDPRSIPVTSEGGRNNQLTSYVGRWIRDGLSENELLEAAITANNIFDPPLPDNEVKYLVRHAYRRWSDAKK